MNDEEAVLRCQSGNREAFRHLVETYQDVLYGTAYLMTGNATFIKRHVQEGSLTGYPDKPCLVHILVNTPNRGIFQRSLTDLTNVVYELKIRRQCQSLKGRNRQHT